MNTNTINYNLMTDISLTKATYDDLLYFTGEIERLLTVLELQNIKPGTRISYMREVITLSTKVRQVLFSIK